MINESLFSREKKSFICHTRTQNSSHFEVNICVAQEREDWTRRQGGWACMLSTTKELHNLWWLPAPSSATRFRWWKILYITRLLWPRALAKAWPLTVPIQEIIWEKNFLAQSAWYGWACGMFSSSAIGWELLRRKCWVTLIRVYVSHWPDTEEQRAGSCVFSALADSASGRQVTWTAVMCHLQEHHKNKRKKNHLSRSRRLTHCSLPHLYGR